MKTNKKTIGISILGGGMASVAYAGMLKALSERNININAFVASSGGAVVASAFANGRTSEEIKKHFLNFNPVTLFNPWRIIIERKLNYKAWLIHMSKLVSKDALIQDSKIKLAIHVTNLQTKNSEYLTEGKIVDSVVASSAMIGSYSMNNKKYADGDYDPETSASILSSLGADFKILVYTETKGFNRILPFDITQKNAIESDQIIHPVNQVLILKLDKSSLFNRKWIEQNYIEGYLQTLKFIDTFLN